MFGAWVTGKLITKMGMSEVQLLSKKGNEFSFKLIEFEVIFRK